MGIRIRPWIDQATLIRVMSAFHHKRRLRKTYNGNKVNSTYYLKTDLIIADVGVNTFVKNSLILCHHETHS